MRTRGNTSIVLGVALALLAGTEYEGGEDGEAGALGFLRGVLHLVRVHQCFSFWQKVSSRLAVAKSGMGMNSFGGEDIPGADDPHPRRYAQPGKSGSAAASSVMTAIPEDQLGRGRLNERHGVQVMDQGVPLGGLGGTHRRQTPGNASGALRNHRAPSLRMYEATVAMSPKLWPRCAAVSPKLWPHYLEHPFRSEFLNFRT